MTTKSTEKKIDHDAWANAMATVYINSQHQWQGKFKTTNLKMAQRDQDFQVGDGLSSGSSFGFTMQVDCWNTGFIIDDFNVLHGGNGTLGLHAERFEYDFLANSMSCE